MRYHRRYGLAIQGFEPWPFSPVYSKLSNADLADWVLNCGFPVRLQLQLHKMIWPDTQRGV